MSYMGQDEFCLDIDDFTTDQASDCFTRLVARREEALQEAQRRIPMLRRMLEAQYDRLLAFSPERWRTRETEVAVGPVVDRIPSWWRADDRRTTVRGRRGRQGPPPR